MTPRQDPLPGVIICPAYWKGQRFKGELLHLWSTLFSGGIEVVFVNGGLDAFPPLPILPAVIFSWAAIGNQSSLKPGKETQSFDVVGLLDERTLRRNRRFRSKPLFVMRITSAAYNDA